jgi:hypothetical protein
MTPAFTRDIPSGGTFIIATFSEDGTSGLTIPAQRLSPGITDFSVSGIVHGSSPPFAAVGSAPVTVELTITYDSGASDVINYVGQFTYDGTAAPPTPYWRLNFDWDFSELAKTLPDGYKGYVTGINIAVVNIYGAWSGALGSYCVLTAYSTAVAGEGLTRALCGVAEGLSPDSTLGITGTSMVALSVQRSAAGTVTPVDALTMVDVEAATELNARATHAFSTSSI